MMMRYLQRAAIIFTLLLQGAMACHAQPPLITPQLQWTVSRVPAWNAMFNRDTGWSGADGIYSIPLSGFDRGPADPAERTLFLFSDTFIGDVDAAGSRLPGTTMVNNTVALLDGSAPLTQNIAFYWRTDLGGNPQAMFVPSTANSLPGDWYWLQDGISLNRKVYLFPLRMMTGSGGVFNFAVAGVSRIILPVDSPTPIADQLQADTPLFYAPTDGRGEIIFGASILANTVEAGAPYPDGYIYIYGSQNDPLNKKLVAARVTAAQFEDFNQWQFWDGTGWSPAIDSAAPITTRISSEFSVTPLPDGRFILVYQQDTMGPETAVRIGSSPVGPFGKATTIYTCPEAALDPNIYCYNAKAHPHLSKPNELLISYNVNTFNFADHFTYADIYRPRFITLRTGP